jgi:large subunit ribosomal protein L25
VKNGLGVLVKVMHEVEIKALPKDVPHAVTVDLGSLETLESHIAVKDLALGAGIEVLADADGVVASIASIKEESEESAGPIDFSQIEVAKKGKKEEEGEAAE